MEAFTINLSANAEKTRKETGWYLSGCLPPLHSMSLFPIDHESFVIGRRAGVNLQLASARVSGRHAEILLIGQHLFLRDLGSTNGTFVNRKRVKQPTPVGDGDHIEIADIEFRLEFRDRRADGMNRGEKNKTAQCVDSFEPDWMLSQFDALIREKAITPHFQPIVNLRDGTMFGMEALARSTICGLENPGLMFQTAQLVHREVELSLVCRQRAVEVVQEAKQKPRLFLNTHPLESLSIDVLPSVMLLKEAAPDLPLVIEIHEGTVQDPTSFREFAAHLRDLNVELAYDDFGAGRSRLVELVKAPPDFLKFDACLIRDVHLATAHQWKMLKMLVDMAHDFPTNALAEGIESIEEAQACKDLGFDSAQGYYYGKPRPFSQTMYDSQKFSL